MASQKMSENNKKVSEVAIRSNTVVGAQYCQFASVTVTSVDTMIEFVYLNQRSKEQGEVVSRIVMPKDTAKDLANLLLQLLSKSEK